LLRRKGNRLVSTVGRAKKPSMYNGALPETSALNDE
jgi:hypothetical protein